MSNLQNPKQWEPTDAPVKNAPGERSPGALRAVLAQFDVAKNPRYQRTPTSTFCNIFAWDATRALGCEIPHWVESPRHELNVNATVEWLEIVGPEAGWKELDKLDATLCASTGRPTVAIWKNPTGKSGHIAMLLPTGRIAQAGAQCLFDVPLAQGFGVVKPIRFFSHE